MMSAARLVKKFPQTSPTHAKTGFTAHIFKHIVFVSLVVNAKECFWIWNVRGLGQCIVEKE